MLTMTPEPIPNRNTCGEGLGCGGVSRPRSGQRIKVQRPPRSPVRSWHGGVAGEGRPGGYLVLPYELKGPAVAWPVSQPLIPAVGLGQRGLAGRRSTRRCPVTRPDSAKRRRGGGSSLGRLLPAALTG